MASRGGGSRRKPPASKPKSGGSRPAGPAKAAPAAGGKDGPRTETRTQRVEAARQARRRREARRKQAMIAAAVVVGLGIVAFIVSGNAADRAERNRLNEILTAGDCEVDQRADAGSEHIPDPTYEVDDPPAGGDHTPEAASEGVYDPGEAPPDGPLVHALEHGFVILWYQPTISAEDRERLEDIAAKDSNATLVVPRETLDVPVAASAWHQRLRCNGVEERPLTEFIKAYRDKGPEKGFIT